ncbi:TetR/AcrR family transcriptional regulator [Thalassobacillus pellis]|uniref:TetR/AcrR family transcriptional regulator n=1 Tax=Thalassobacillus pellis TaxID=748008 RepID=UPI001EF84CE2|nr:TetR/AcrR family transcriptional regulator [Thalassobacillus pellis]MBM7553128.1 AcrR family transcriptional regulator [Thalassobacillus pellis]
MNAAFREFAENGFEQASTNAIVKEAGIGKGMLFYYFKNKQGLFYYLIDHSLDVVIDEYFQRIDADEGDFIERLNKAAKIKMETFLAHPNLFRFVGAFMLFDEKEIPDKFKERLAQIQRLGYELIYENIDYSLFRDDIDVKKAFNLIRWSMDGYQNEMKARLKDQNFATIDLDPIWEEFHEYLEILKKTFYAQGRD